MERSGYRRVDVRPLINGKGARMAKSESTATAQPDVGSATDVALREFVGYNMKRAFHMIQGDVNAALAPRPVWR